MVVVIMVWWWYSEGVVDSGGRDSCSKDGNYDCCLIVGFKCVLGGVFLISLVLRRGFGRFYSIVYSGLG